ncbi:XTP/dITP diphosphatase [Bacillota bacterium LX-D]|nr:XTP/dITP diphosphatase [Bacillota bacterium LX-D]
MLEIVVATRNQGKLKEFKQLIQGLPIKLYSLDDFTEIPEIAETGSTFQENALLKARIVSQTTGLVTLADDSGLEVDKLHGEPGIYSARYAGEPTNDQANNAKLLNKLQGIPLAERTARFRAVIAIYLPEGKYYFAEGSCAGLIGLEPKGNFGFGYDPLFILPDLNKTMAELALEEKNEFSHRAKAFRQSVAILEKIIDKTAK